MAKTMFLSQAASLMLFAGEPELSSFFIRKLHENKIIEERDRELGPGDSTPCGALRKKPSGKSTQQKKGSSTDTANVFPGYFCQICGRLQNPVLVNFRVHPRIRKRKQKKGRNSSSSYEKHHKCRNERNARKNPYISCKCSFCGHAKKLVCYPDIRLEDKKVDSSSGNIFISGSLKGESCIKKARKMRMEDIADTPKSTFSAYSRSSCSRKKSKSKSSPLTKILLANKKEAASSPNLRSFLLNA